MSYRQERAPHPIVVCSLIVVAIVAAIVAVWLIIWGITAIFGFGPTHLHDTVGLVQGGLFPGGLPTPFFWILASIVLAVGMIVSAYSGDSDGMLATAWVVAVVIVVASIVLGIVKGVTHDIIASDYYLETSSLEVKNPDVLPTMLVKYVDQGSVTIPINQGDLNSEWVPRVASMTGALKVLSKTSGSINNAELMTDTLTYLYGEGDSGAWTAIRNSGGQQDIYGISSWNGTGDANRIETCRFDGDYSLNRNFGGMWGKNLWNSVVNAYPSFFYNESDMWGYCDGGEPIIVIPGVRLTHTDMRTVDAPGGVVTIRGSKSGEPVMDMVVDVKPGDFPGPVYAQRLVNSQRDALDWGAGYWQSVNEHFGFDATSVDSQLGNNSNYLLKSKKDGRLYWVTPLKPQASDDQTLIAYSIILADEVTSNLNPQVVSVLNEDDPRVVNLDDLFAYAQDAVCNLPDPNFCTDTPKGQIVEFLPVTDTHWQAFGEISGRVKYLVDLEIGGATIKTSTTTLETDQPDFGAETDGGTNPSTGGDGSISCDDPSSLTNQQLADCLTALADELQNRNGTE